MAGYDILTYLLIFIFLFPLIIGFFRPFSRERVQRSLGSMLDNIEFLVALILSFYTTKQIFFDDSADIFKRIYGLIPESARDFLYGKDVLTYIIVVPVVLLILSIILRIVTNPLYTRLVVPLANALHTRISKMGRVLRRIISALWQMPKALCLTLIFTTAINFYSYYIYSPTLNKWMNDSDIYQFIYYNALKPVLSSNIAKRIPVIVNDSFRNAIGEVIPARGDTLAREIGDKLSKELNIKVIEYFNGVTLDEAVKSTEEIDGTAKEIANRETTSKGKAFLIYEWVSNNIEYDFEKAEQISENPRGIQSGAIVAYKTGKGICFDYSSLYIAMCRAAGLKVRMVTGLAYSGMSWGDHAWNQVYIDEEDRWVNVDTTFGSIADYFDRPDFDVDHRYAEIQGEW